MNAEQKYAEARLALDIAMAAFLTAAGAVDKGAQQIVDDVADSLCDASNREIILFDSTIQ